MDLDLNQEPLDSSTGSMVGLGSVLNELETSHDHIEERIRRLRSVTGRERQRQRWRRARNHLPVTDRALTETFDSALGEGSMQNGEYSVGTAKIGQSGGFHLIAKVLELDTDDKKVSGEGGMGFDCNICLDMAREPILTCCGHLFCWACFYKLPYVYSMAKECPVCNGEVNDTDVTPIYGNGRNTHVSGSESGEKVPPRPKAHRVESVRQQQINRGVSHVPVAEALRRIRMRIGDTRERRFTRVFSETAASLSSISSGLNNQRLFEDHQELFIPDPILGGSHGQILHQTVDSIAEIGSVGTVASSSGRTDLSTSVVHLENPGPDAPTGINLIEPRPSSSSRRSNRLSRVSSVDNGVSHAPRRRRLYFDMNSYFM
ncbi:E3 ubiquitin-protein like [Actinidia chinensis var. chinensis]|uniref:E3 ubiquitin-protein ligase RMA n=1 Tax=Actinidia chinensis var. chinensis TaxID=1590841 RepID=A0A2R6RAB7_ACTCC|nr:E3 ubiquitin-protein like [Actinidia chinensis var. chinensis]